MANSAVNERNILVLNENDKKVAGMVTALNDRVDKMERTLAVMAAEITNTKQMIAHVSGRGMGPTVREE